MKIFLRTSGGFANIRIEGEIDTADLPDELAGKAEELLKPGSIPSTPGPENLNLTDSRQFSIHVTTENDSTNYDLDETSAKPDLLELLNDLVQEIVRRKT